MSDSKDMDFSYNHDPDSSDVPWRHDNCDYCGRTADSAIRMGTGPIEIRVHINEVPCWKMVCSEECADSDFKHYEIVADNRRKHEKETEEKKEN